MNRLEVIGLAVDVNRDQTRLKRLIAAASPKPARFATPPYDFALDSNPELSNPALQMRTFPPLLTLARMLFALSLASLATFGARAQSAASGSIEGRVLDSTRGGYLENARVTIEGTGLETFTDDGGYFVLGNVPAGAVKMRVFFTGLSAVTVPVEVTAGRATTKDVTLGDTSGTRPSTGETVRLSEFVVSTSKEMDGAAIAINEQRVAQNIKNVVTADEFGTIVDGTPGEAIKFLPGVMLTYSAGEAREVSINGVPTANVPVTVGGFDLATNAGGGTGRQTNFEQVSINNMSRIEVIQSPTPERAERGRSVTG